MSTKERTSTKLALATYDSAKVEAFHAYTKATESARATYNAAFEPVRKAYKEGGAEDAWRFLEKVTAPAGVAFLDAIKPAEIAYNETLRVLEQTFTATCALADIAYLDVLLN